MLVVMNPQRVRCSPKGSSSSSLFRDYSPQLYYQSCFLSQSAAVLNCKTKQNKTVINQLYTICPALNSWQTKL